MADAIETNGNEATFASRRQPAWHGLGTVFTEDLNTRQMLDTAHLSNWNVRLEAVEFPESYTSHKTFFSVVRDNPFDKTEQNVLGMVGERYKVLQNEDLFDFGDNILDGGGRWETAGSISNGTKVFGSLALEHKTVLDPNGVADEINTYLLVSSSHDGSSSIQASITPVRVVCANTLAVALKGTKQSFKIRHTATAQGKVAQAREALGLAEAYMTEFDRMAQRMIETTVTKAQFDKMLEVAYPQPEADIKGSLAKWQTKIDLIQNLYIGDTNNTITGTAWGAFNALEEQIDWYRTARGNNGESLLADASGFNPLITSKKNQLLEIVNSFTN